MQDIRCVIVDRPGPQRVAGTSFEQPGLAGHVAHCRQWLGAGKLLAGGPFLDAFAPGVMVPQAGLSQEEIEAFAQSDPAVASGPRVAEVHPWLLGKKAG